MNDNANYILELLRSGMSVDDIAKQSRPVNVIKLRKLAVKPWPPRLRGGWQKPVLRNRFLTGGV